MQSVNVKAGPSSAFEKWSGHEIRVPKARRVGGDHERGHSPSRKGGSGDLPREIFIFPDVCRDDFNALWDNVCPCSAAYFIGFIMMKPCPGQKP